MAFKFHNQQKQRKWAQQRVVFSSRFLEHVNALASDSTQSSAVQALANELRNFSQIQYTCNEMEDIKPLMAVFQKQLEQGTLLGQELATALQLVLEIVFSDNSRPLHRAILSGVKKHLVKPEQEDILAKVLQTRIAEAASELLATVAAVTETATTATTTPGSAQHDSLQLKDKKPPKLTLGQALFSLSMFPKFQDWVAPVCSSAVTAIAQITHLALRFSATQQHTAPSMMSEIQDSFSAAYYLIQKQGNNMAQTAEGKQALLQITQAMLYGLQGNILVREAMSSAAVSVWVAALCPHIPPQHAAAQFAQGLFLSIEQLAKGIEVVATTPQGAQQTSDNVLANADHGLTPRSAIEEGLRSLRTNLSLEISRFSPVGKLCALKGLATAIPAQAMCWPLKVIQPSNNTRAADTCGMEQAGSRHGNTEEAPTLDSLDPQGVDVLQGRDILPPGKSFTFLIDGALMFACQQVQRAPDAHYKFHAACLANSCMEQILNIIKQGPEALSPCSPPRMSDSVQTAVLSMLWSNIDEPLAQTAKQLQGMFEMLLDFLALHQRQEQQITAAGSNSAHAMQTDSSNAPSGLGGPMLSQLAKQLIAMPVSRKGRYSWLASMVRHLGACQLLAMHPPLIQESLAAMQVDNLAGASTGLFKSLLEELRHECKQQPVYAPGKQQRVDGQADDIIAAAAWHSWWLEELVSTLTSGQDRVRYYVSVYALPVVLGLEPTLVVKLIQMTLSMPAASSQGGSTYSQLQDSSDTHMTDDGMHESGNDGRLPTDVTVGSHAVAALISLLKVARQMQLVADLDTLAKSEPSMGIDVEKVLLQAVTHASEGVRVDCLELAALNPKATEPSGSLELQVISRWLACCLRSTSATYRNRCLVILSKCFARMKIAINGIQNRASTKSAGATGGRFAGALKGRAVPPVLGKQAGLAAGQAEGGVALGSDAMESVRQADAAALARLQLFCHWVSTTMITNLYPGAPFERKYLSLEVLNAMLSVWPLDTTSSDVPNGKTGAQGPVFMPYNPKLLTAPIIQLLLANAIDSWEKLRQSASTALMRLPTPWPGVDNPATLQPLLAWSFQLLCSPRLREADAGARILRLIFAKYVTRLHWRITLWPQLSIQKADPQGSSQQQGLLEATHTFFKSILDQLQDFCKQAGGSEDGLLEVCRNSFAHGPLLLLRYIVEEIKWSTLADSVPGAAALLRGQVDRLVQLLHDITALAAPSLSAPVEGVGAADVDATDMEFVDDADGDDMDIDVCGPDAQVIITGCWLTLKEVALVAGTVSHCLPLAEDESSTQSVDNDTTPQPISHAVPLLDGDSLASLGRLLVPELMLVVKHNGVLDKASMALTTLCMRLLRSTSPAISKQPAGLLDLVMKKLLAPGQSLTDITRRSGGMPLAICAVLKAEPANSPKALLARTMTQLLAVANQGAPAYWPALAAVPRLQGGDIQPHVAAASTTNSDGHDWLLAEADEPWPRVHAFNCLRTLFNDANLAVDTSGFHAAGLQACMTALGDAAWQVRNGATLCLTALMARVLGFKNLVRGEAPRNAITGAEFFQRYPTLHAFLKTQLTEAVHVLEHDPATITNSGSTEPKVQLRLPQMHSCLYPILLLLSRLRPGPPSGQKQSSTGPGLAVEAFIPLVQRCAAARHYAVRQLAARALPPLIPIEQVLGWMTGLLAQLPGAESATATNAMDTTAIANEAPLQRRHDPNACQGLLMQLECLLYQNIHPGAVPRVLELTTPYLISAWNVVNSQSLPAAIQVALLRCCSAVMSLMQPSHCQTYTNFITIVSEQCHHVINNTANTASQLVDFSDPMISILRKEAAQLWVGLSVVCSACSVKDSTPAVQSLVATLLDRLRVCLASGSVDVRAGSAKAAGILQCIASRLQKAGNDTISLGRATHLGSACAIQAAEDRWSHIMSHSQQTLGASLTIQQLETHLNSIEAIAWGCLQQEPVHKVRKRLLRVIHAQQSIKVCIARQTSTIQLPSADSNQSAQRACSTSSAQESIARLELMQRLLPQACGVEERSECLRCIGPLLQQAMEQGTTATSGSTAMALRIFTDLVEESSDPTQPDDIRLAAVHALQSSQCLLWRPSEPLSNAAHEDSMATSALSCWRAALRLSEDEDANVRELASQMMLEAMTAADARSGNCGQQLHIEGVQRLAFSWITNRYMHCSQLVPMLFDLISNKHDETPAVLLQPTGSVVEQGYEETSAASQASDVRKDNTEEGRESLDSSALLKQRFIRIFDPELANQHEEPLFFSQLAAMQLHFLGLEFNKTQSGNGSACVAGSTAVGNRQQLLNCMIKHCADQLAAAIQDLSQAHVIIRGSASHSTSQLLQDPALTPWLYRRLLVAATALNILPGSVVSVELQGKIQDVIASLRVAGLLAGPLAAVAQPLQAVIGNHGVQPEQPIMHVLWRDLEPCFLTSEGCNGLVICGATCFLLDMMPSEIVHEV